MNHNNVVDLKELRQRAEKLVSPNQNHDFSAMSLAQIAELFYELETHQIELEMQNKQLVLTQDVLKEVRNEFLDLYNTAPNGYLTTDTKGHIYKLNDTMSHLLERSKSDISRKLFSTYIEDEYQDVYYQHKKTVLASKAKQSCELRLKLPSGKQSWVRMDSICEYNVLDQKYNYIRSAIFDIASEKHRQITFQQSYNLLEDLNNEWLDESITLNDPIFLYDAEGSILKANQAYLDKVGKPFKDVIGQPYWTQFPVQEGPFWDCLEITEEIGETSKVIDLTLKGGETVICRSFPVLNSQGKFKYSINVIKELTERESIKEPE